MANNSEKNTEGANYFRMQAMTKEVTHKAENESLEQREMRLTRQMMDAHRDRLSGEPLRELHRDWQETEMQVLGMIGNQDGRLNYLLWAFDFDRRMMR